jgi:hypothetical protein
MLLVITTHEEAALEVRCHGGYVLASILQLLPLLARFPDRSHHNSSCSLPLLTHLAGSVYSLSAENFRVAAVGAALVLQRVDRLNVRKYHAMTFQKLLLLIITTKNDLHLNIFPLRCWFFLPGSS